MLGQIDVDVSRLVSQTGGNFALLMIHLVHTNREPLDPFRFSVGTIDIIMFLSEFYNNMYLLNYIITKKLIFN